jgi:RNA recognition motif-containing protein
MLNDWKILGMTDQRQVFVGGLHDDVTEEIVMGSFAIFGEILNLDIPRDPQTLTHRGFAILEYADPSDAKEAIFNMDGSELFGRTLRVKWSNRRSWIQLNDPKKAVWADEIYMRKMQSGVKS